MEASPFGTLSGELRNRIYHYFFNSQLATQTHLDVRDKHLKLKRNQNKTRNALALTAACHQLRCETLALFWSTASFRIVADTLTAYSHPSDPIPGVHPMNRANHINWDRKATLEEWLQYSGIGNFARLLRPVELDLGVWDPRTHEDSHQHILLGMLAGNTATLTDLLKSIDTFANSSKGDNGSENDNDNDVDGDEDVTPVCTLLFKVQVKPSTALGSIRVPNERKHALTTVANLSKMREESVQASFDEGMLTPHGRVVLMNDVVMCRSVADMLIKYIVRDEEEEEASNSMVGRKKGQAAKKGHVGKKAKLGKQ